MIMELDIGVDRPDSSYDKDIIIDPIARRILENIPPEMRKTTLRAIYCALEVAYLSEESTDFLRMTLDSGTAIFLSMDVFKKDGHDQIIFDEYVINGTINDGDNTISDQRINIVMPQTVVSTLSGEFPLSKLIESRFTEGVNAVLSQTFESNGKTVAQLIVVRDETKISDFLSEWIGDPEWMSSGSI